MAKRMRYKQIEQLLTRILLADTAVFILYLIFAGFGLTFLKVVTVIIALAASGLSLAYLFLTQELLKKRSLWMSVSAGAILICLLVSLILNFPSPNPYKDANVPTSVTQVEA